MRERSVLGLTPEHFSRSSFALNHPTTRSQRHDEERLPQNGWEWPKETWFQSRRNYPPSKIPSRRQKIRAGDQLPMEQPGTIFMEF
jgi:hypothetical protein